MVAGNPPADITAANENSLKSLGRAIAFSQGQFSLVLVCCNYGILREQMLQRLQDEYLAGYQIHQVALPHNVINVYTAIHLQLTNNQPSALFVMQSQTCKAGESA
ncbi:hypothetical protein [Fischerella sp. JS2]|uniref:hypothetical protein n=1 Tax=Fischerella sp. JS2 TaxID=2597771 RepID=UPI0028E69710|nr:hypothetical protein [Fischerella sp. JS2]